MFNKFIENNSNDLSNKLLFYDKNNFKITFSKILNLKNVLSTLNENKTLATLLDTDIVLNVHNARNILCLRKCAIPYVKFLRAVPFALSKCFYILSQLSLSLQS